MKLIVIDENSGKALYIQIADAIEDEIVCGNIAKNDFLPTKNALAAELNVCSSTVGRAYLKLIKEQKIIKCVRNRFIVL